ncbi:penicillin-binding protein [Rossellomorea vietnamensis]|uniref:serine-type D-Ala-D-Ala carboxypeptidase n=1 Tax=Rossellomorea vietnamensis TaxID=218284 RepID=A0A5D4M9U8_9BACI|nr:penicillin-binding transpeptidase domain-containing protein [Rossellomorea vietnamensis]TYR98462.1 penicillin-binding protein [Rossellomorea vietnamensis]
MKKRPGMRIGAAILFGFFGLLFFVLMIRFVTIQVTGEADGKALAAQAAKKYLKTGVLEAARGTIYDQKGEVIAEDTSAYTLVAILDDSVSKDSEKPKHVQDIRKTAEVLAPLLEADESKLYERLSQGVEKKRFQVEFGSPGRGLSHQLKLDIEKQELPGITFVKESKRFYPNGIFSSHLIGFAQKEEKDDNSTEIVGKMGIEQSLNDYLTGKNGKVKYDSDKWGYILPQTEEHVTPPQNGNDVYLTIDKKIQTFLEETMSKVDQQYKPENMLAVVADPKTGKILAMAQRPTFHPDTREDLQSWQNEIVESSYEPGSTMKSFSLAAAVEEGVFDPNAYYESGRYYVGDQSIGDWNYGKGWGTITYLEGLQRSSNVAFAELLERIGEDKYKEYLNSFGFGKATGIELPNESAGRILYNYPIERVTTIFGQGSTVTPLQLIQAETAIANNGKMMKPYIIEKIVDHDSKKVIQKREPDIAGTPISEGTAKKVREYLASTVTSENGTGKPFALEGYQVAGKSGTAQIIDENGKYQGGKENFLFSFLGMAPADDPQLIVYVAVKKPTLSGSEIGSDPVSDVFNPVMLNSLKYLNIKPEKSKSLKKAEVPDLTGESVEKAKKQLEDAGLKPVIIGNGPQVKNQSVSSGEELLQGERIVLRTDGDLTVPDMRGWSVRDVLKVTKMSNLKLNIAGTGYVTKQNITPGSTVKEDEPLVVTFQTPEQQQEEEKNASETDEEAPLN